MKDAEEEYVKCLMEIIELKHWNKVLSAQHLYISKRHNSIGRPSPGQNVPYLLGC